MHIKWLIAATLAAGLALATPAAASAGFEEGAAAYQQGDYTTALREWTPLAEQGNLQAQYNIGYMHFNGIGVPKAPDKAARWFAMAAEQGDAAAQMSLGVMNGTGQGVPQDYTQAYIWLTLAAARLPYGDDRDQAVKNRDIVSAKMTRAQITEALGQALNWTPKTNGAAGAQAVVASTPLAIPVAPASGASGNTSAVPGEQIAAANGNDAAASKATAEAKAAEEAKRAAEAKAAAEAKVAAEAKAAAEAKVAAETKAAAEAKMAAETMAAKAAAEAKATAESEAKAAAEVKAAAEAKAVAEAEAKMVAEAKAAAEAKVAAEAKAAAEAKVAAETKAAAEAEVKAAAEAKAAVPPAPVPPAPANTQTAALTPGTGYLIQLASLRSVDAAQTEWLRMKRRHADVLGGMEPVLQSVDLGTKGTYVRVHIGPFSNQNEASEVCRTLRSQSQDCVVVSAKGRTG